jgi:hypothetical protein
MISDAGEHIGEPGTRVDVVQLGSGDERVDLAARSPPRSLPANSQAFLPRATPRSARSAALLVRQTRPALRVGSTASNG